MRPEAAAILVAGVLVVAAAAALGQSDELAAGRRVFEDNCAVCHGANGEGTKRFEAVTQSRPS